jgi:hypothetical protein
MELRFRTRRAELRRAAHVPTGLFRGLAPRLDAFLRPFVAALAREEQRGNAGRYVPFIDTYPTLLVAPPPVIALLLNGVRELLPAAENFVRLGGN